MKAKRRHDWAIKIIETTTAHWISSNPTGRWASGLFFCLVERDFLKKNNLGPPMRMGQGQMIF
jgi:hypothetical protein